MKQSDYHTYPFGTIPKRLNDFFKPMKHSIIGRNDELEQVRRNLLEGRAIVLVNGIGGIGKTTIARTYVEQHWEDYRHVAWLTVASPQSIGQNPMARMAEEDYSPLRDAFLQDQILWKNLGVTTEVEQRMLNKDLAGAFATICRQLSQLEDCLLVVDNANNAADLLEHRPIFKSLDAHVLATSRANPKGWAVVTVDELPLPLAVELFRQHYQHPSLTAATEADLTILVETLFRHTLLLELVAKYASPKGANLPFPRLMESLQDHSFHHGYLNELPVDAGDHADGPNLRRQATIESYIALMFTHVSWEQSELKDLLKAMTLLPSARFYERDELGSHCKLLGFEYEPKRAETLVQLGWLDRAPLSDGGIGYSMHPLILDVAFRELGVTAEWADAVILHVALEIHYDSSDPQHNLSAKRNIQPHAEHLGKLFWEEDTESVSLLLDRLANLEDMYGFLISSVRFGERALAIAETSLSKETIAIRQSNLASVHLKLENYSRAINLLNAALSSDLENFGREHFKVAVRQFHLGNLYRTLGEHTRARDLLEAALKSDLKNFGPDHPTVAVTQSNLAILYGELGEYALARDLLEAALKSYLKNFGPEHPHILVYRSNLAHVYFFEGNFSAAIGQFQEALNIVEKMFGQEHPHFRQIAENLEKAEQAKRFQEINLIREIIEKSPLSFKQNSENLKKTEQAAKEEKSGFAERLRRVFRKAASDFGKK